MVIGKVEVKVVLSPPRAEPLRDALQSLPGGASVEVRVHGAGGLVGEGRSFFGRAPGSARAVAVLAEEVLAPLVEGRETAEIAALHEAMLRETEYAGSVGLAMFGIAAVDTALWDLSGRAAGVPCLELWGAMRDRVPAYAMVGWLNYEGEELARICRQAVARGFRAVKIKVGCPTLEEDLRRIEVVRKAVGPDVRVMVDANQVHTLEEAVRRGRAYEGEGCFWYEEPLPARSFRAYGELARELAIPVAAGENLYEAAEFDELLGAGGADLLQPDLRRAGGPTGVMAAARLAEGARVPWASHGGGPEMLSLLCALPGAEWLETGLGGPFPRLEDGCALAPRGPGFSWE